MIRNIIFTTLFLCGFIFPQTSKETKLFSKYQFSLLGGINFENSSDILEAFYVEGATNIFTNFYIKLSVGYYKSISNESYRVNTYKFVNIGDYNKYNTITYNVLKTTYQSIPISLGLQYTAEYDVFKPYTFVDISYNLIDPLLLKSREIKISEYDSFDQIPAEYLKTNVLTNGSYGLSIGIGCQYFFLSSFSINLRYLYKYDTDILNSHQFVAGITF